MTAEVATPRVAAPTAPHRQFRPEIEGLRALAAFLVMTYHIFLGRVSGGVDVFFVVAGFLITLMLASQVASDGTVRPARYFSRLATRLLPLALTVLLVVTVAVLLLSPPWRQEGWWQETLASAAYLENWALADKAVVYLGQGEPSSPVQHFWALSIQGQFYVIWLAVFAVAAFLGRRWHFRSVLITMLVVLFTGSLAFSIWLTRENQPLAYFHTGTRMWEFAAGGLIALLMWKLPSRGKALGFAAGWLGVAMIASGGLLFPVSTAFPGYIALWPVVGCALVLWAGQSPAARTRGSATWLLGSSSLVFLGTLAYAIYLWHWPILTFYRAKFGEGSVPLLPGLVIMGTAVLLAIITTKLLEKPARTWIGQHLRPWPTAAAGLAAAAALAVLAFGLAHLAPLGPERVVGVAAVTAAGHPGAAAGAAVDAPYSIPFAPDVMTAFTQRPEIYSDCHQDPYVSAPRECVFGDAASSTSIMLVGGSHSAQFFPALKPLASANNWKLISVTKSACRFTADPQPAGEEGRSCEEWNQQLMQRILAAPPTLVITTATVSGGAGQPEYVPSGYLAHWDRLGEAGVNVLAVRDTPRWPSTPLDCLWSNSGDTASCEVDRAYSLAASDPAGATSLPGNVTRMDLTDILCGPITCPAVVGNIVAYYDGEHITPALSATLSPTFESHITQLTRASTGR